MILIHKNKSFPDNFTIKSRISSWHFRKTEYANKIAMKIFYIYIIGNRTERPLSFLLTDANLNTLSAVFLWNFSIFSVTTGKLIFMQSSFKISEIDNHIGNHSWEMHLLEVKCSRRAKTVTDKIFSMKQWIKKIL